MKTPEELAEEYASRYHNELSRLLAATSFLAGYQAAKDQLDTALASRDAWKEDAERYADNAEYWKAQAATPQWISVRERMPEMNELCIVNTEVRGVVVAHYGSESWVFDNAQGYCEKPLSYATHWMPLPQPPNEEA
jgi:hypothetical protein